MGNRVLLVEDDVQMRNVVKEFLALIKVDLVEASNGKEALSILEKQKIDVVVADIVMPEMDGMEVLNRLRNAANPIPYIFCSGFADKINLKKALQLGAFDFIEKPFSSQELLSTVERALKKSQKDLRSQLGELNLKARHIEIIELLLEGHTNKEIAQSINISEQCIKYHLSTLFHKFGAKNRTDLRTAIRNALHP